MQAVEFGEEFGEVFGLKRPAATSESFEVSFVVAWHLPPICKARLASSVWAIARGSARGKACMGTSRCLLTC